MVVIDFAPRSNEKLRDSVIKHELLICDVSDLSTFQFDYYIKRSEGIKQFKDAIELLSYLKKTVTK